MRACACLSAPCVVYTRAHVKSRKRRHETLGALDASRRSHRDERLSTTSFFVFLNPRLSECVTETK